jgi:protein-arginine kinase activator protein McsA
MKGKRHIQSFGQFNENLNISDVRSSKKTIGQISDDIEELEDIKNRYEQKGDFERASKIQDKIDVLKKEFKDSL